MQGEMTTRATMSSGGGVGGRVMIRIQTSRRERRLVEEADEGKGVPASEKAGMWGEDVA
jgi:hypothetical protein